MPAIEAYRADNGTYAGVTVSGLRTTYDVRVPDVGIVVTSRDSYCVESDVDGLTYSRNRLPRAVPGAAGDGTAGATGGREPAADDRRGDGGPLGAHRLVRGCHRSIARADGPGPAPLRVVYADRLGYCIEVTGEGYTYAARGPGGEVGVGRCRAAR
jgi:hypothetical protein